MFLSGTRELGTVKTGNKRRIMPKRLILIYLIICISPSLIFSQTLPFTFSPNTPAKAEEVNSNFQFLAKQFKKNEKTINCPNDNISQAIADGYNHLIINGTCLFPLLLHGIYLNLNNMTTSIILLNLHWKVEPMVSLKMIQICHGVCWFMAGFKYKKFDA